MVRKQTDIIHKLNKEQQDAVYDTSNVCLVNANVGSGKTTVLIAKILYLHYEKQVPYDAMMVLTFTNKAADEIKERLLGLEPELDMDQLKWFGTFHSIAMTLLQDRLPLEQIGYEKGFTIIEPEEEQELALSIIKERKLNIKYKNRLKKRLDQESPSRYKDDLDQLRSILVAEKKEKNRMSFQDLLHYAVELLSKEPPSKVESRKEDYTQLPLRWIIIDEVQDSDQKQLEMISLLKKEDTCLFAVGDPNQVIYSWRGSMFHVFGYLRRQYQATEYTLSKNYRSNESILEIARCFQELGKPVEGTGIKGEHIVVKEQYDSFQEALYLADRIGEIVKAGVAYEEIAIFYRLKEQGDMLAKVLTREEIPCTEEVESDHKVRLMTLHTSKGLEFSHVFIIGLNPGLIPLTKGGSTEEEEERRLLYVGITRAKHHLELYYYTNPDIHGVQPGPSKYLSYLPKNQVDWQGKYEQKADLRRIRKLVQEEIRRTASGRDVMEVSEIPMQPKTKMMRHPHYGVGCLVAEDEMMITIEFQEYGQMEFMKMFTPLEEVDL